MASLPPLSFEFFPPHTDQAVSDLQKTGKVLSGYKPDFFSVTFGAGGGTRELTVETVRELGDRTGIEVAPHISCVGASRETILHSLTIYFEMGVKRIVVLRGDLPSGDIGVGEFRFASDLVEFIRLEKGKNFRIEVAAYPEVHPQSVNASSDLENFKRKVDAGANSAITQFFYNVDAYNRFVENCECMGISIPIVPGVMPITNYRNLSRFASSCGAEIPRWLDKRLLEYEEDLESLRSFGVDVVTKLCERLIADGAPGLHFFSMNKHSSASAICDFLGYGCEVVE